MRAILLLFATFLSAQAAAGPIRCGDWLKSPIQLGEHQFLVPQINEMLHIDVESMTAGEFSTLAERWAIGDLKIQSPSPYLAYDESYVLEVLKAIHAPAEWMAELTKTCVRTRLDNFKARDLSGEVQDFDRDRDEIYAFEACLRESSRNVSAGSLNFLLDILREVTDLHAQGWSYKYELLNSAIEDLDEVFIAARQAKVGELRATLIWRSSELKEIYNTLLKIRDIPKEAHSKPYEGLRYGDAAAKLFQILDVIGTWK